MAGIIRALIFGVLLLPAAWAAEPVPARTIRSTTSSGQFVIYSSDAAWRTAVARRAEDARRAWNTWIGSDGEWKYPIIIQDRRRDAPPAGNPRAVTAIYEADAGALKVQTDVYDASVLAGEGFDIEIFKAIGLEQIYRDTPPKAGRPFHQIPPWMSQGMMEDLRVDRDGTPDGVYAAILRSDRPPKLDDFLKARPDMMEATSLAIYRTQALALLRALRQMPEGGAGLKALVQSMAEGDAGMKDILAAFPSLGGDPAKLARLWTLAIARGSTAHRIEPLSIPETSRALSAVLELSAPVDARKPEAGMVSGAAALPAIARGAGGPFIMRQKAAELFNLEVRGSPLLRPVIAEYRSIATLLAEKPRRNLDKRIEENDKIRALLEKRTGGVADYLNWFEATQLDSLDGDEFKISDPPAAPPRTDAITRAIDAIEQRGW